MIQFELEDVEVTEARDEAHRDFRATPNYDTALVDAGQTVLGRISVKSQSELGLVTDIDMWDGSGKPYSVPTCTGRLPGGSFEALLDNNWMVATIAKLL